MVVLSVCLFVWSFRNFVFVWVLLLFALFFICLVDRCLVFETVLKYPRRALSSLLTEEGLELLIPILCFLNAEVMVSEWDRSIVELSR